MTDPMYPFHLFRFHLEFRCEGQDGVVNLAYGAFSECTGLEATMEPKVIKAGGANYGAAQRVGPISFATVILKRGITTNHDLWKWFSHVNERGKYAFRMDVTIAIQGEIENESESSRSSSSGRTETSPIMIARLSRAVPVKFKFGDLNARTTEVGIEELHLAHEGLTFE